MPTFRLDNQVAVVTGAASGIGRASALALAGAGASVIVNHLPFEAEAAAQAVAEIEAKQGKALAVAADISDEEQVAALFARAAEAFGTVHILVNNAGIQRDSAFPDMTLAQWEKVIGVNLTGQFLCARAAAREFLRRGPQPDISKALGKIICMSSVHQIIPWAGHANYAASKGGVTLLMETMAQELAGKKIRINSIAPGAIRTPINHTVWEDERMKKNLLALIPYGRIGEPEDVADTVVWLASDFSDYINGATIAVDGGMLLYPGFRGNG
jgi:glucose 1-dehydrogenase